MDSFVFKGSKMLRKGVTTGTCAAAASAAAARMLLSGERSRNINVTLPGGNEIILEVESTEVLDTGVRCSIRKYAGDDPDITDGMLICSFAEAFRLSNDSPFGSKVIIEGGDGPCYKNWLGSANRFCRDKFCPKKDDRRSCSQRNAEDGF